MRQYKRRYTPYKKCKRANYKARKFGYAKKKVVGKPYASNTSNPFVKINANGRPSINNKNRRMMNYITKTHPRNMPAGKRADAPNFMPKNTMDNQAYEPAQSVVSTQVGTYLNNKGSSKNLTKRKTHMPVQSSSASATESAGSVMALKASLPPFPESTYMNWSGNLCFKLAFGYWCALRRAYFTVGWPGQNDKYTPPYISSQQWDPFYPVDRMFINYIAQIFCNVHDSLRDGTKPQVQVPKHIMFALQFIAKKTMVQTNVSTVDLGTYAVMVPWGGSSSPKKITLEMLQSDSFSPVVDMYNWISNHPKRPFEMSDGFVAESKISIYTKENSGELIHSTMKYDEITSIYGYAKINLDSVVENYDYSGMKQPTSTAHFRSMFYLYQEQKFEPDMPGVAPAIIAKFQYIKPDYNILNYCMTGFVVTAERVFPALVPWPGDPGDVSNGYKTSAFLNEIQAFVSRVSTVVPFDVPPANFNCGLALALALQTKNNNFVQQSISNYYDTGEAFENRDNELSMAVAISQFPERIPLPSPLFEELKSVSDIKSWTYEGVAEPVGCYYQTPSCWSVASLLGDPDPKDPRAQLNRFFTAVKKLTSNLLPYRGYMRLNHAPEIGSYMPNMHLFYTDGQKVYTPLDSRTFDDRDIAIFLNYSLMPVVPSTVALPLNFLSVKTRDISYAVFNLAALSVDLSTNTNPGSEVDEYYRLLRMKHIGFWGALAGLLGAALPKVLDFASHIFKPTDKTKEKVNNTIDNVSNGSQLINSAINGVINHIDSKQIGITGGQTSKLRKVLGLASNGLGMVANLRNTKIL